MSYFKLIPDYRKNSAACNGYSLQLATKTTHAPRTLFLCFPDRLGFGGHPELVVDVMQMRLHRIQRNF